MKIRVQVGAYSCCSYTISELTQEKFAEIVKKNNGKVPENCHDWADFRDDYGGDDEFWGVPLKNIGVHNIRVYDLDNVDEENPFGTLIDDDLERECKFTENNDCNVVYQCSKWPNPKAAVDEIVSKGNVAVCDIEVYGTNEEENIGVKWVLDIEGEFDPAKLEFFYFDSLGDNTGRLTHHISYNGKNDTIEQELSVEGTKEQAFKVFGYKGEGYAMKKCPKCGKELNDTAKFCGGCGYKFEDAAPAPAADGTVCPKCGAALKPGAKFCGKCGYKIAEAAPVSAPAAGGNDRAEFSLVSSFIHWNILPGQIAVKIDENDVAAYGRVKGISIQDGVKALFFAGGKFVAELESGDYSFKSLGADDVGSEKKDVMPAATPEQKAAKKKGLFSNIISGLSDFFSGTNRERAAQAGLTGRISGPAVSIVLVRDVEFPLLFDFKDAGTANLRSEVALHILCRVGNINEFYKNQLLDRKFVCFDTFSQAVTPVVKNILDKNLSGVTPDAVGGSDAVLAALQAGVGAVYPYIAVTRIISLSAAQADLEELRRSREELYVSEQELTELSRRNDFLNRLASEQNKQSLAEAHTQAEFAAAMEKIDEQNELTKDEKDRFALMLSAQRQLREATTQNDTDAALAKLKQSGMLRGEELETLQHQIANRAALRDLSDGQTIALMTLQNSEALDKEKLNWETEIGNRRVENELNRQRMQDNYTDERRSADAAFDDERRRSTIDIDKAEMQNQMDALRQAQQIRMEREAAVHQQEMESQKQADNVMLEKNRIYAGMTFEQIMAANPDISEAAAQALAEKFRANAADDKVAMAMQQKDEMRSFMEQQMGLMRDMVAGNAAAKGDALAAKDAELQRTRDDAEKNQDRYTHVMETTVQAVAHGTQGNPKVKCAKCGTLNDAGTKFCENCGEAL